MNDKNVQKLDFQFDAKELKKELEWVLNDADIKYL